MSDRDDDAIREDERKRVIAVIEARIAGLYEVFDAPPTANIPKPHRDTALAGAMELRQVCNLLSRADRFEEYYSVHCNRGPRGPNPP